LHVAVNVRINCSFVHLLHYICKTARISVSLGISSVAELMHRSNRRVYWLHRTTAHNDLYVFTISCLTVDCPTVGDNSGSAAVEGAGGGADTDGCAVTTGDETTVDEADVADTVLLLTIPRQRYPPTTQRQAQAVHSTAEKGTPTLSASVMMPEVTLPTRVVMNASTMLELIS